MVDELGYVPFDREAAQLLFEFFSDRYETRAQGHRPDESCRMRESWWRAAFGSIPSSGVDCPA